MNLLNKISVKYSFAKQLHTEGCWNWQTSPPVSGVRVTE